MVLSSPPPKQQVNYHGDFEGHFFNLCGEEGSPVSCPLGSKGKTTTLGETVLIVSANLETWMIGVIQFGYHAWSTTTSGPSSPHCLGVAHKFEGKPHKQWVLFSYFSPEWPWTGGENSLISKHTPTQSNLQLYLYIWNRTKDENMHLANQYVS